MLLGTLFAALYGTLSSRLVGARIRVESLLFWQLSVCTALVIVTLALSGDFSLRADQFNVYAVSSGALVYGLSFYFYLVGMQYIPTHLSAILLCLTPIFGVAFSMLFLSETINAQNVAGFAMNLVASVFVTREATV